MLTYLNKSDQKRRAIIIIYEKVICFVTASCYSSCYWVDEGATVFCICNSLLDFYLHNVYWNKSPYFCFEPLAALCNFCNSANSSNNTTKHRAVFQKNTTYRLHKSLEGICDKLAGKKNGIFWVSTASTDADLKMQQGPSLKVKLPMKEAGKDTML